MDAAATTTPLARAESALRGRHDSPREARALALAVLDETDDPEATVVALWALGLADRELNDLEGAQRHLERAAELAGGAELTERRRGVRSALVNVITMRGRAGDALELADELRPELAGLELAELEMKRALALLQLGRVDEAIDAYTAALPAVQDGDDRALEVRLLSNRGNALAYQDRLREAIDDSLAAYRIADEIDQPFLAGCAIHNAGFVHGRNGDVVAALRAFDRAEVKYAEVGFPGRCDGVLAADRCEVLLIAGLLTEARASADAAVRALEGVEDVSDLAEARLLQARAALSMADHAAAAEAATAAHRDFMRAGRPAWAVLAEVIAIRSGAGLGSDGDRELASAERVAELADQLEAAGWHAEATAVLLNAGELALDEDDVLAEQLLERAAAAKRIRRPDTSAAAWLATARLRALRGDRSGAQRAVDAGIRSIARHRSRVGATELKIGASVHATELAALSVRLAVAGGAPRRILRSAELLRSSALRRTRDPARQEEIAEERVRVRELQRRHRDDPGNDELRTALARQERRLRRRARSLDGQGVVDADFDVGHLIDALDGADLVEFLEHDGALGAVTIEAGRCRFRQLGRIDELADSLDGCRFALSRLARDGASAASLDAAAGTLEVGLADLDERLLAPLALRSDRCVVVPTGALHDVPWSGLRSVREAAVSVATSARHWSGAWHDGLVPGRLSLAAGPDIDHGDREIDAVAGHYRRADVVRGDGATVEAVLGLVDGADIAHIACHGAFRADSPMFSSLLLADGPLNVYDIESLAAPPQLVILPVCNAARAQVAPGDELIGTSSALRGVGVCSVIAPLTVISDRATVGIMDRLHAGLARGVAPVEALATARMDAITSGDPAGLAAACALLVLE